MNRRLVLCASLASLLATAILMIDNSTARAADLGVGDPAPPIVVKSFVQGDPIANLADGKITIVEFWATWDGLSVKVIPQLTQLARENPQIRFLGVSVWERDQSQVAPFVQGMGDKMPYPVALDSIPTDAHGSGDGVMSRTWLAAAHRTAIPTAFLVDGAGRIEWIGDAAIVEGPLSELAAVNWDDPTERAAYQLKVAVRVQRTQISAALNALGKSRKPEQIISALDALVAKDPLIEMQTAPIKFSCLREEKKEDEALAYATNFVNVVAKGRGMSHGLNEIAWQIVDPDAKIKPNAAMLSIAVQAAHDAVEASGRSKANILDTFAVAQFENGDAGLAIETEQRAVEVAGEQQDAEGQKVYGARLAAFKSGKVR